MEPSAAVRAWSAVAARTQPAMRGRVTSAAISGSMVKSCTTLTDETNSIFTPPMSKNIV
jgi:hypothetical protein